jgi:hypothetical protein
MVQDPSFAGYHRGEVAIPEVPGPVFNVLSYGADATGIADSTDEIQAAINAAQNAGGGVVYMPEGTYLLSKPGGQNYGLRITKSDVVLRGAGTNKTFLINTTTSMRSSRLIRALPSGGSNWATPEGPTALIAQDYPGPTQEVVLTTWLNFQVGEWIVLNNPFTDTIQPGGSFVQDVLMDGSAAANPNWLGDGDALGGPMMYRQIVAIDAGAKKIWLDAPTRWYLLTRDGARVYRVDEVLEEVGMENFSIGNTRHPSTLNFGDGDYSDPTKAAYEVHDSYMLSMERVRNSWVRNVRSFNPGNNNGIHLLSNGLVLDWTRGVTVEDVEMQSTQYGGGGGNGYMIRLNSVNETLVKHSRAAYCRHGIVMWRMQNSGNVMYRNLDEFTGVQLSNTGTLQNTGGRGSDHHGLFSHSNLFDRHVLRQSFVEAAFRGTSGTSLPHSQSSSQSLYWNAEGKQYYTGRSYIVHSEQGGRGYVIGTQGAANGAINTPKISGSGSFTTPVDRIEGIGLGETLEPASLYEDQLAKRFAREGITPPPTETLPPLGIELNAPASLMTFRIESLFGFDYQLQQSSTLLPGDWSENGDPLTGSGAELVWPDISLTPPNPAFFRVTTLP